MKIKDFFQIVGNGLQYLISFVQVENALRITGIILSVIISLLIIIDKIRTWWKNAKADGKITKEEVEEGVKIITDGVEEIKEHIEDKK